MIWAMVILMEEGVVQVVAVDVNVTNGVVVRDESDATGVKITINTFKRWKKQTVVVDLRAMEEWHRLMNLLVICAVEDVEERPWWVLYQQKKLLLLLLHDRGDDAPLWLLPKERRRRHLVPSPLSELLRPPRTVEDEFVVPHWSPT